MFELVILAFFGAIGFWQCLNWLDAWTDRRKQRRSLAGHAKQDMHYLDDGRRLTITSMSYERLGDDR